MNEEKPLLSDYLQHWLETQQGLGLILFFWFMLATLLGGLALLLLGIMQWSPWWFLLGLISLRLFAWSLDIGGTTLQRLFSGDI